MSTLDKIQDLEAALEAGKSYEAGSPGFPLAVNKVPSFETYLTDKALKIYGNRLYTNSDNMRYLARIVNKEENGLPPETQVKQLAETDLIQGGCLIPCCSVELCPGENGEQRLMLLIYVTSPLSREELNSKLGKEPAFTQEGECPHRFDCSKVPRLSKDGV